MPSLTWLDYSEQERRQAMEVIDLFREEDTRDELGLGTIRDAFADLLFPGTSTIQTRARYFLFVPWFYADIERRRVGRARSGRPVAPAARAAAGRTDRRRRGGGRDRLPRRAAVRRLPSSVYWNGLRRWGVLRFHGSEEDYHRHLARHEGRRGIGVAADAGETAEPLPANWDPNLPLRRTSSRRKWTSR